MAHPGKQATDSKEGRSLTVADSRAEWIAFHQALAPELNDAQRMLVVRMASRAAARPTTGAIPAQPATGRTRSRSVV
jgi:hypothetical protein